MQRTVFIRAPVAPAYSVVQHYPTNLAPKTQRENGCKFVMAALKLLNL